MNFESLALPLLYFTSFGAMLVLVASAIGVIAWGVTKLWRVAIRMLRRALEE